MALFGGRLAIESSPGMPRILLALALLAAVFFLSLEGLRPPARVLASAPETEFSAERAREVLRRILGNGAPHPVGSPADDAVRERAVAEFTKAGYTPKIETGFTCDEFGACATVKNVVARLDGTTPGNAVLVSAHYDSVPAGPGASDDGVGTACVIEIARAIKARPKLTHPVIFLLNEGEEAGRLGAHVFVDSDPWAKEVRAAVNIDNRGTSGPSVMFETGSANAWALELYAEHTTYPSASSISYTVYKLLPNETDFTVYKAAGYQGLNFGFIGDVAHYHTPQDNFENASPASIQHSGDNALPSVIALAKYPDLSNLPTGDAVYFDIVGRKVVWWPARWGLPIAFAVLVLLLFEIGWIFYNKRLTLAALLWGLAGWLVILLVAAGAGFGLHWVLQRVGSLPVNWTAHQLLVQAAFWSLAAAVVVFVSMALARPAGLVGLWAGVWIWWAIAAALLARIEPGLSYVLLVPAGVAVIGGATFALWLKPGSEEKRGAGLAVMAPLVAAGIVTFPLAILLYDAMGNRLLAGVSIAIALLLTPLAPLVEDLKTSRPFARLVFLAVASGVPALAIFGSVVAPAYSAKSPERVNLEYKLDADDGKGEWLVQAESGKLPEPLHVATQFRRKDDGAFPWSMRRVFVADAPRLVMNAPTFTILESSVGADSQSRSYRALLRSERGAPSASVLFPPNSGIAAMRAEGVSVGPRAELMRRYLRGWTLFRCLTMPAKGVELTFTLPAGKPVEVYVVDRTYELPLEGMYLQKARPFTATRSQDGDGTIVSRRVQLLP